MALYCELNYVWTLIGSKFKKRKKNNGKGNCWLVPVHASVVISLAGHLLAVATFVVVGVPTELPVIVVGSVAQTGTGVAICHRLLVQAGPIKGLSLAVQSAYFGFLGAGRE